MRKFLFVTATLVSVAAATPVSAQPTADARPVSELTEENLRAFEEGILGSPGRPTYLAIKRLYPGEYDALIKEVFQFASQHRGDKAELRRIGFEGITKFFLLKMPDLVNAPAPDLARINRGQLELVRALRKDHARECAKYVLTGFDSQTELPPELHARVAGLSVLMFESAKAGGQRERDPSRGSADEKAIAMWLEKVEQVEPSEAIRNMMGDEAAQKTASHDQTCQMGEAIFAAVAEMPDEQAAKITAFLLAASMVPDG